jgi:hypothetical protein
MLTSSDFKVQVIYEYLRDTHKDFEGFAIKREHELRNPAPPEPPPMRTQHIFDGVIRASSDGFGMPQGVSVLKHKDGTFETVQSPTQTQRNEAERVYIGGGQNLVTPEEAEELRAAGYMVREIQVPA